MSRSQRQNMKDTDMVNKMKMVRFIGKYVKRYKWQYAGGILTLLVVDICNLFIPQFTGEITDGLQQGSMDAGGVLRRVFFIVGLGAVIALGRFLWRFFLFGSARKVERDLRDDMFGHLEGLSLRYFNENKTGDLMSKFTNDLNAVRVAVGPAVITSFDATAMMALVLCKMIFSIDLKLTLAALVPLVLIAFGDYYYGKLQNARFSEKQEAFSELTDRVQESISGIRVVKAFVQERKELQAFAALNEKNRRKNLRVAGIQALFMPLLDLVIGISSLVTLLYGGWLALTGDISLGQFIAFNQYIAMMVWPLLAAGESITYFSQGFASMKRIHSIFEEKPDVFDTEDTEEIDSLEGTIDFRDLTFAYPDQEGVAVLDKISLHVEKGSILAIVGRTGSGKTTIANLLLRMYNTRSDMITIDGHPIHTIPLKTLREYIAYVPQDNFLFSDTLENNITFGVKNATREDVYRAAKTACIHRNIVEFPAGYRTMVGERGVTLSGGQKQRSSIARALLKDAPILILDDALSAVDTDTEEQILKNLKENRAGKTTIMIAHRISTIQQADQILVLEDGHKAECGTHEELLALNGIYKSIYDRQQLEKQLEQA